MHQRIKLVSILVLLVVSLILSAWLIDFSDHMQIWIPIILAGMLGAASMHVFHIWSSTSTTKVGIKPEDTHAIDQTNEHADTHEATHDVKHTTKPEVRYELMSEASEHEDKKTILAAEDLLI